MTISQWPKYFKEMALDTSTLLHLGGFIFPRAVELEGVLVHMRKVGTLGGSESSQVKLYTNSDLTAPIATSTAKAVSAASSMTGAGAAGRFWLYHEFSSPIPVAASRTYHLGQLLASYTRNGDTFYLSALMDDEVSPNFPLYGKENPAAMVRFVWKE